MFPLASDDAFAWIDSMSDAECMEVFWLYLESPEPFLTRHPPALIGAAMRRALRDVAAVDARARRTAAGLASQ